MMLMYKKEGGYMYCYTPHEIKRAESKGWAIVEEKPKTVKKNANKSSRRR